MSHVGSILCVPSGIYGWDPQTLEDIDGPSLGRVVEERDLIDVLLLGVGPEPRPAPADAGARACGRPASGSTPHDDGRRQSGNVNNVDGVGKERRVRRRAPRRRLMDFVADVRATQTGRPSSRPLSARGRKACGPRAPRPFGGAYQRGGPLRKCRRIVETGARPPRRRDPPSVVVRDADPPNVGYGEGGGVPLVEALRDGVTRPTAGPSTRWSR